MSPSRKVKEKTGFYCYKVANCFSSKEQKDIFFETQWQYCQTHNKDEEYRENILSTLKRYKGSGFFLMNKFARGTLEEGSPYLRYEINTNIKYYQELVERLDQIIYHAPRYDFPIFCYRGIGLDKSQDLNLNINILNDMGFKSCSLSPQICLGFSGDELKLILLQIKINKNIPILFMENCRHRVGVIKDKIVNEMFKSEHYQEMFNGEHSFHGDSEFSDIEDEILFPRNVRLRTIDTLESVEQAFKEFFRNDAKLLQIDVETY